MGLLDDILGSPLFSSGNVAGGMPPDMAGAPPSGYLPPDPRDMSIQGFPPGGPPLPRPRPPEAGPGMMSAPAGMPTGDGGPPAPMGLPGAPMALPGAPPPGGTGGGGLMAALGLSNPERLKSVIAAFGGGLKNVKNSPFPGEVFAGAAGGGIEAGDKQDQQTYTDKLQALDRALKLQQIKQLGSYRDDMADAKFGGLNIAQQRADQTGDYQTGRLALGDRQATVKEQLVPSQIDRNTASAAANNAKADPNMPADKRLIAADKSTSTWFRDQQAPLRDELRSINNSAQPAEAKAAQTASVQQRLNDLAIEAVNIKIKNRREYGLNDDGTDARPKSGRQGAAPVTPNATAVSPDRPKKFVMGTEDDPHMPQTQADFDAIPVGQVFINPATGKPKVKE